MGVPAAAEQQDELASLGARLVAQVIDWVITVGIILLMFPIEQVSDVLAVIAVYTGLAYYLVCDGLPGGQSLGKRVVGIACLNADNNKPCGYGRSAVRNITQALGILDWIWIFGERKRRAGDVLAHTKVVKMSKA